MKMVLTLRNTKSEDDIKREENPKNEDNLKYSNDTRKEKVHPSW